MGFQRDCVPLAESRDRVSGGFGQRPSCVRRFAKGEFQNSPVDCFERGNALQVKAFPLEYLDYSKPTFLTLADFDYFVTIVSISEYRYSAVIFVL